MDFLRNTNIDFMKYRKFFIGFSVAVMVVGAIAVSIALSLIYPPEQSEPEAAAE